MTNKIYSHHDRLFKKAMADKRVASEFFEVHLPESIRELVDFKTLAFSKDSFVDAEMKSHLADVVYHAKIAGKEGYLVILVEHQSSVDKLMPFRVMKYIINVLQAHIDQKREGEFPIVYPIVFYNGDKPYDESLDIFDLFGERKALAKTVLFKPVQLVDVGLIDDEAMRKHIWLGTLEFVFKYVKQARNLLMELEKLKPQLIIMEREGGVDLLVIMVEYMLLQGEASNAEHVIEFIKETFSEEVGEKIMTIAEQLREKGKLEGIKEGVELEKRLMAQKLLKEGFESKKVATLTELTLIEVEKLQKQQAH